MQKRYSSHSWYKLLMASLFMSCTICSTTLLALAENINTKTKVSSEGSSLKGKADTKQTVELTTGSSNTETKTTYEQTMEARLAEIGRKLDECISQAKDVKTQAVENIEKLKAKQEAAMKTLETLKASSGQAWDDLKVAFEKARKDLELSFEEMKHPNKTVTKTDK